MSRAARGGGGRRNPGRIPIRILEEFLLLGLDNSPNGDVIESGNIGLSSAFIGFTYHVRQ
jgi:hypothetical protein